MGSSIKLLIRAFVITLIYGGQVQSNDVVSETKGIKDPNSDTEIGLVRYHYDSENSSCDTILILGVGTFMAVGDYDKLSAAVSSGHTLIVAIADHNPDNFQKTSSAKYANLVNQLAAQVRKLVPICKNQHPNFLIGGHSASGEAAMKAFQDDLWDSKDVKPIGFIGLDPYEISKKTIGNTSTFRLSGLYWGFTRTTCLVSVEKAAHAAYELTTKDSRVLYSIHNDDGCDMTHCVFTDNGCGLGPVMCGSHKEYDWVHGLVAESIHRFLSALMQSIPFSHELFRLADAPQKVELRINDDEFLDALKSSTLRG